MDLHEHAESGRGESDHSERRDPAQGQTGGERIQADRGRFSHGRTPRGRLPLLDL